MLYRFTWKDTVTYTAMVEADNEQAAEHALWMDDGNHFVADKQYVRGSLLVTRYPNPKAASEASSVHSNGHCNR